MRSIHRILSVRHAAEMVRAEEERLAAEDAEKYAKDRLQEELAQPPTLKWIEDETKGYSWPTDLSK